MPEQTRNIKVIVAAGVPVPDAIRSALPGTLTAFADRHGFNAPHVSLCIHGRAPYTRIRAALAAELGVDLEWLSAQLDSHTAVA